MAAGVKAAVIPFGAATVPATGPPGPVSVKVVEERVAGFMNSLKVAVMAMLIGTPVALFRGTVEVTEGGGAVVKLHTKMLASGAPATFVTPVVSVAV